MTGILITARLGSSRLPEKHLLTAAGHPFMWWLVSRMEHEFRNEIKKGEVKIVIATSVMPVNKKLEAAIEGLNAEVFYGSDENIPLRHYECAQHYGMEHIISIDGDDILCSFKAARRLYEMMQEDMGADLYSITGLPLGMNLSGYNSAYLGRCLEQSRSKKLETGWGRIFKEGRTVTASIGDHDIHSELRFTLDYEADAEFFRKVIEELGELAITISDEKLIEMVNQKKLYELNSFLYEKYWNNYNTLKQQEENEERRL